MDEIEKESEKRVGAETYLSSDTLQMLDRRNERVGAAGDAPGVCDEKLRKIMTYLDEVDTAERLTQIDEVQCIFCLHNYTCIDSYMYCTFM